MICFISKRFMKIFYGDEPDKWTACVYAVLYFYGHIYFF